MNSTSPSCLVPYHFVDSNKMVKTGSNAVDFDGIKPLEIERFEITAPSV
jgi:hypothetical protein